jgi:spermidine synthase
MNVYGFSDDAPRRLMISIVCAAFFASGFSALVFETLWFRQAGLALGNSVWASGVVLSSFMGGMALGNAIAMRYGDRAKNPLRLYAIAEIIIAVTGVGLVYGFPLAGPALAPWLRMFMDHAVALNGFRLAIAMLLLLIPSTAMGLTLPLLTKSITAYDTDFGPALGRLYGWNTLGAVAGAVLSETFLLGALGIRRTAVAGGALNLIAAAIAFKLSSQWVMPVSISSGENRMAPRRSANTRWLWGAFCSGFCMLALEIIWFRFLLLFVTGHSLAFALMLGCVLTGIALGGLAGSRCLRLFPEAYRHASAVAWLEGALCVAGYAIFPWVLQHVSNPPGSITKPLDILYVCAPLLLPVSFLSGLFFTFMGAALHHDLHDQAKSSGALTLANTIGAAVGSLCGSFVLLPLIGTGRSFFLIAMLYGILGASLLTREKAARRIAYACVGVWFIAVALFPFGLFEKRFLRFIFDRSARGTSARIVAFHEGLTETVVYFEHLLFKQTLSHVMITNAFAMSGTSYPNRRYMKLFVYWPLAVYPDIKRSLLICYGVGNTAKALTDTKTMETLDIVDISRDVLGMSAVIDPNQHNRSLEDPRVHVHIEDGRQFLQLTDKRFDLITAEPPPPGIAGVENLYTREYFQLLSGRLAPGGIVTYWLPLHELTDVSAKAIVRAFCDVFSDCSLWNATGSDLMLAGTLNAQGPVEEKRFVEQWHTAGVRDEMKALGIEQPEQLGALFIGDSLYLKKMTALTPTLTDDAPKLIEAPSESMEEEQRFSNSLRDTAAARERFAHSPLIDHLWPRELKVRSLAFFNAQKVIDAYFWRDALTPRVRLESIHFLLTKTSLALPVLWLYGSDADIQRIRADTTVLALYALCMSGQFDRARQWMKDHSQPIPPPLLKWIETTFPQVK